MQFNLRGLSDVVPTPDDTAWYDVIGKFKNAVAKFQQQYSSLQSEQINAQAFPELAQQQLNLLKRGADLKYQIQGITNAVDSMWGWLKTTFGFDGVRQIGQVNGLGIAPLIPIAAVIGIIAYLATYAIDYMDHANQYNIMQKLLAQNYTPEQVNELMKTGKTSGTPLVDFSNISKVAMFGIAGFIGYQVWKNWKR